MGYGLEGQGLIPGRGKRFSLLSSTQTGSGAHPASIQWAHYIHLLALLVYVFIIRYILDIAHELVRLIV
jgi:hypothetical protein